MSSQGTVISSQASFATEHDQYVVYGKVAIEVEVWHSVKKSSNLVSDHDGDVVFHYVLTPTIDHDGRTLCGNTVAEHAQKVGFDPVTG